MAGRASCQTHRQRSAAGAGQTHLHAGRLHAANSSGTLTYSGGGERFGLRLCEYSVQGNHIHLIAEATDRRALWRGIQGLAIRIARTVNRSLGRRGSVFADRYHARALKTPLEVRNALRYVLHNAAHHAGARRGRRACAWLDPCSSAAAFGGWVGRSGGAATPLVADEAVVRPLTWLLRVGWRRKGGLLRASDAPSAQRR